MKINVCFIMIQCFFKRIEEFKTDHDNFQYFTIYESVVLNLTMLTFANQQKQCVHIYKEKMLEDKCYC